MANLDDVVTVQKNGVVAVNTLVQVLEAFNNIYSNVVGEASFAGISTDTLVRSGAGRIVTVCVIVAAAGGTIHDVDTVGSAGNSNAVYGIPNAIGAYTINFPVATGIVVKPAAGSRISISYSLE